MPIETLLGDGPEEYLRALVAVAFAGAMAVARLGSHIDRDALRRAIRTLSVGMRIYR